MSYSLALLSTLPEHNLLNPNEATAASAGSGKAASVSSSSRKHAPPPPTTFVVDHDDDTSSCQSSITTNASSKYRKRVPASRNRREPRYDDYYSYYYTKPTLASFLEDSFSVDLQSLASVGSDAHTTTSRYCHHNNGNDDDEDDEACTIATDLSDDTKSIASFFSGDLRVVDRRSWQRKRRSKNSKSDDKSISSSASFSQPTTIQRGSICHPRGRQSSYDVPEKTHRSNIRDVFETCVGIPIPPKQRRTPTERRPRQAPLDLTINVTEKKQPSTKQNKKKSDKKQKKQKQKKNKTTSSQNSVSSTVTVVTAATAASSPSQKEGRRLRLRAKLYGDLPNPLL